MFSQFSTLNSCFARHSNLTVSYHTSEVSLQIHQSLDGPLGRVNTSYLPLHVQPLSPPGWFAKSPAAMIEGRLTLWVGEPLVTNPLRSALSPPMQPSLFHFLVSLSSITNYNLLTARNSITPAGSHQNVTVDNPTERWKSNLP